jgi:hypothetical protein
MTPRTILNFREQREETKMAIRRSSLAILLCISALVFLRACQSLSSSPAPTTASLRTDSTEITVYHSDIAYSAEIGFVYTNTTSKPVAKAGCGSPPFPDLEKKVNEKWVMAYNPAYLMCLTRPDFSLRSGQSYHGVLRFNAFDRGHNTLPILAVDSIDGTYRLRWDFVEGTDTQVKGSRTVQSISNEFRMVLSAQ